MREEGQIGFPEGVEDPPLKCEHAAHSLFAQLETRLIVGFDVLKREA